MQAPTEYNEAPPRRKSTNWVWLVVGGVAVCGCGGFLILGALVIPVFMQARRSAVRVQCMSNIKQISLAQLTYALDNDDHWPTSAKWIDQTEKYVREARVYTCPVVRRQHDEYGYASNSALGGKKTAETVDPATTVLIYETNKLQRNAAGDPNSESNLNRHVTGRTVGHADGSAKFIKVAGPSG